MVYRPFCPASVFEYVTQLLEYDGHHTKVIKRKPARQATNHHPNPIMSIHCNQSQNQWILHLQFDKHWSILYRSRNQILTTVHIFELKQRQNQSYNCRLHHQSRMMHLRVKDDGFDSLKGVLDSHRWCIGSPRWCLDNHRWWLWQSRGLILIPYV